MKANFHQESSRGSFWIVLAASAALWFLIWLLVKLLFFTPAQAQPAAVYELAESYAAKGDGPRAEQAYGEILRGFPGDRKALLGRATARAWQGKDDLSEADFKQVLAQNPNDLEALVGLGYNFAWAERFSEAEPTFKRALDVAPDNIGAQKGLGYTYLWSDRLREAHTIFEQISASNPSDAEARTAIAQTEMQSGRTRSAVRSYKEALQLEPSRTDAIQGLRAAYGAPALLELSVWGGTASGGGDTGLRLVELASWVNELTRIWARFDNSLSLDNPALARSNLDARTYYGGILRKFGEAWFGLLEFGFRDLPAGANQEIYKAEVTNLSNNRAAKLGGQISPHSDGYTDELVYAGYNFPLGERWRMEPTVFYSNAGAANDDEWRGVMFAEYKAPKGWTFGAGAGGGYIDSNIPGASGGVFVANALASVPVGGYHSLYASVRYEDNPFNDFVVAQVGVTLRLPRN